MVGEQRPNRLVVEGKDDKHTIIHLMRRHSVDWDADERAPFIRRLRVCRCCLIP